jgi:hypothetical protein
MLPIHHWSRLRRNAIIARGRKRELQRWVNGKKDCAARELTYFDARPISALVAAEIWPRGGQKSVAGISPAGGKGAAPVLDRRRFLFLAAPTS